MQPESPPTELPPTQNPEPEQMATPPPQAIDPMIVNNHPTEAGTPAEDEKPKVQPKASEPPNLKPVKPKDKSVTAAIFATVIIVFGLALLAVYAYTSSHK